MKSYLVTGGAGFMGRDFIRHLLEKKETEKVICYDAMTYAAKEENIEEFYLDTRFNFVKGDILDRNLFRQTLQNYQIDCVVHYAAESHVDRSIEDPMIFVQTNVLGTVSLLEVVKSNPNVHFHHISTDEVYGSLNETGFFYETSPYQPNSPYSASKAASDHFVLAYAKTYGLSVTISHASNNYGPYQYEEKLIPKFIHHMINKQPFPLYGTGKNIREWTYVEDHSRAVYKIIHKGTRGQVYNIGSQEEKSNLEILKDLIYIFSEKTGEEILQLQNLVRFVTDRKGHDFRYSMDCSKIKALGFETKVSLTQGLERTIDFCIERLRVNI